jgi:hypothetical protein
VGKRASFEAPKGAHLRMTAVLWEDWEYGWLVQRFAHGMFQPFDLVLDHQFSALQLDNLQVVCRKMHEGIV